MGRTQTIGNYGEELAEAYLRKKGYKTIARQWRAKTGEIDLIMANKGAFIFVEVKLRAPSTFGTPEDTVTKAKQHKLMRTAEYYCQKNNVTQPWQIDVVAITARPGFPPKILHFENAVGWE